MAQSLKVRKALKKGSLRRKTPAHPPSPVIVSSDFLSGDWSKFFIPNNVLLEKLRARKVDATPRPMVWGDLEQPAPPPLCKDCRWFKADRTKLADWSKCRHPNFATRNLVTGEVEYQPRHCDICRTYGGVDCGPSGRWFEPAAHASQSEAQATSLLSRLKAWWPL